MLHLLGDVTFFLQKISKVFQDEATAVQDVNTQVLHEELFQQHFSKRFS